MRRGTFAFRGVAALLIAGGAWPAYAQASGRSTGFSAKDPAVARPPSPIRPHYVVPLPPADQRTQKQRCWDAQLAGLSGPPSDLDRQAIDLKCSQR